MTGSFPPCLVATTRFPIFMKLKFCYIRRGVRILKPEITNYSHTGECFCPGSGRRIVAASVVVGGASLADLLASPQPTTRKDNNSFLVYPEYHH
jgi:hypothetical protein